MGKQHQRGSPATTTTDSPLVLHHVRVVGVGTKKLMMRTEPKPGSPPVGPSDADPSSALRGHPGRGAWTSPSAPPAQPTHEATDRMAYLMNASKILQGVLPRKPFNITPDGDLWEWFANIVNAKGAEAVRLTKVKGYATDKMVLPGKS